MNALDAMRINFSFFISVSVYEAKVHALENMILGKNQHYENRLNTHVVNQFAEVGGVNAYIICQVFVWYHLQDMRAPV
jgi:hypothetical protein